MADGGGSGGADRRRQRGGEDEPRRVRAHRIDDRSITRDLSWGIPVAYQGKVRPGFEGKVFYVWFDAPIEYIGATMEWADATGNNWKRWWREDEGASDVRYVQVMGKDNVPFHTVGFPVTLFGAQEPWKVVDYIKGLNWMNYYGGKFSTSGSRGLFMDHALEPMGRPTKATETRRPESLGG